MSMEYYTMQFNIHTSRDVEKKKKNEEVWSFKFWFLEPCVQNIILTPTE